MMQHQSPIIRPIHRTTWLPVGVLFPSGWKSKAGPKHQEEIVDEASKQDAHVIGLSILSGSHLPLVEDVIERLKAKKMSHIPVIVGGIIPDEDAEKLIKMGVSKVYTPKNFELNTIMMDIVGLVNPSLIAA